MNGLVGGYRTWSLPLAEFLADRRLTVDGTKFLLGRTAGSAAQRFRQG